MTLYWQNNKFTVVRICCRFKCVYVPFFCCFFLLFMLLSIFTLNEKPNNMNLNDKHFRLVDGSWFILDFQLLFNQKVCFWLFNSFQKWFEKIFRAYVWTIIHHLARLMSISIEVDENLYENDSAFSTFLCVHRYC